MQRLDVLLIHPESAQRSRVGNDFPSPGGDILTPEVRLDGVELPI